MMGKDSLALFCFSFKGDDPQGQDYVSQIGSLKKDPMILSDQQRLPRTVSGYLDLYTSVGLPANVDPRTFLFNVSKFNNQLPRNVNLIFSWKNPFSSVE